MALRLRFLASIRGETEVLDDGRRLWTVILPENRKRIVRRLISIFGGLQEFSKQRKRLWSAESKKVARVLASVTPYVYTVRLQTLNVGRLVLSSNLNWGNSTEGKHN